MPKIFDCFTYFNEVDVLRMRLEELSPVVDKFVIVESNLNFRGQNKGYSLDAQSFIDIYGDKIVHVLLSNLPGNTTWEREIYQRNSIQNVLAEYIKPDEDDIIIISDVDEIPRRSVVKVVNEEYRLLLDKYTYSLNMLTDEGNSTPRMLPYKDINGRTMEEIRRGDAGVLIENAGWEFSSLGDIDHIYNKIHSFAHHEFDHIPKSFMAEQISQGKDLLGRNVNHEVVELDDSWPEAVKNDREYWSKYIWK